MAADYRRRAEEAKCRADLSRYEGDNETFLNIAREFEALASIVERWIEPQGSPSP